MLQHGKYYGFILSGFLLLIGSLGCFYQGFAQKRQPAIKSDNSAKLVTNTSTTLKRFDSLLQTIAAWCVKQPNDKKVLQLLAEPLQKNKVFLQAWEIGLNSRDAQIWHLLCHLQEYPYVMDSSQAKLTCTMPFVKQTGKLPESKGVLQIVSASLLDVENGHDIITSEPNAASKPIGKVKPGEKYSYFSGSTAYAASLKKYVTDAYKDDSEGENNYFAIVLDTAKHQLGYISANATWLSYPVVKWQYEAGKWKIISIQYL